MEISATRIRIAPLERHRSDPLPKITFNGSDVDLKRLEDEEICETQSEASEEHDVTSSLPEVVYGMMPRMAWMCRLMERAGAGTARSARATPWFDNDRDVYQHHAEYLKRLSKLREELINQEQNNLANALERLRMRSYGREFVYQKPQPQKEKKTPTPAPQVRHSARSEVNPTPRNPLLTTFEKFQRMRPKKTQPSIMPLEGKSLIDTDRSTLTERSERSERNGATENGRGAERSVDESVRINLQRLTAQPIASIPRSRRSHHRDIVLESSSFRRQSVNESNNSNASDERIINMQKQKQKLSKLRQEARDMEKLKLQPQSFRIDTLNDEDRMNLEKLKDYYCIYYVPGPTSSPTGNHGDSNDQLPLVSSSHSNMHMHPDASNTSLRNGRTSQHSHRTGYRVVSDIPVPPTVCDGSCRMYVSGNKMEAPFDRLDFSINKIKSANRSVSTHSLNGDAESVVPSSRGTDRPEGIPNRNNNIKTRTPPGSREKMRIRVDMPAIVYNTISTPDLPSAIDYQSASLTKAFKQKELRHKELTNLIEDVRELNQITETLSTIK